MNAFSRQSALNKSLTPNKHPFTTLGKETTFALQLNEAPLRILNLTMFVPLIDGQFHINKQRYPSASQNSLKSHINEFVKRQRPSRLSSSGNRIDFGNSPFRFKVNRGANFLRAFSKGYVEIANSQNEINMRFGGSLTRGVFTTAFYTLVALGFCLFNWQSLYWLPGVIAVISYLSQITLTHIVFPRVVQEEVKKYLMKLEEG